LRKPILDHLLVFNGQGRRISLGSRAPRIILAGKSGQGFFIRQVQPGKWKTVADQKARGKKESGTPTRSLPVKGEDILVRAMGCRLLFFQGLSTALIWSRIRAPLRSSTH